MELAEGGTLTQRAPLLTWPDVAAVVDQLLDALAHAHAHGLVHRDVKPGNIVFGGIRPGLKLTDFGMAYAQARHLDGRASAPVAGGTASAMAPEQITASWGDQGPWTDIYAVGCLMWRLATGHPPWRGPTARLYHAHLTLEPGVFQPRFDVPDGLEAWTRTCLHKQPWQRFRHAADARHALAELGSRPVGRPAYPEPPVGVLHDDPTVVVGRAATVAASHTRRHAPGTPILGVWGPDVPLPRAPVPTRWPDHPRPPLRALATGLGLHGLRATQLVGREPEQRVLWDRLAEVHRDGTPRAVVLRGAAGLGASSLASWLQVASDTVGAASPWVARHADRATPRTGLGGMLARALRIVPGNEPEEVADRVRAALEPRGLGAPEHVAMVAATILDPSGVDIDSRLAATRMVLGAFAGDRPIVARLEDVQWGLSTLRFARRLLDEGRTPTLLVLTARDESLAERPAESAALAEVVAHGRCEVVELQPLADADQLAMITGSLRLTAGLAGRIASRARGNALFARQLVGDLVARDALVATPTGFGLRPGADLRLPDDLHATWAARVARLLRARPDWRDALHLAAVLGVEVDAQEWAAAAASAGIVLPEGLVPHLKRRRLAVAGDGSWRFAHAMLRESLLRSAEASADARRLHRACADTLPVADPRRGWHLARAGAWREALAPLVEGAHLLRVTSGAHDAVVLLETWNQAAEALELPADSRERAEGELAWSRVRLAEGDAEAVRRHTDTVRAIAGARGWPELKARAMVYAADALMGRGTYEDAVALCERALVLAHEARDDDLIGRIHGSIGVAARQQGQLSRSLEHLIGGVRHARQAGKDTAGGMLDLAITAIQLDDPRARTWLAEAAALCERNNDPTNAATCRMMEGDLARAAGDPVAAESLYADAVRTLDLHGSSRRILARINLGFALVEQHRTAEARSILKQALGDGAGAYDDAIELGLLVCSADGDDPVEWLAWRRALESVDARDPDYPRMAELAGDRARPSHPARAEEAWQAALRGWSALGREADVARVTAKMADSGVPGG